MNCLPELRQQLVTATSRLQSAPNHETEPGPKAAALRPNRKRLRTSRRVLALSVGLLLLTAALALAAAGVFSEGTALGPDTPPSAGQREGLPLPGTVKLLPLSAADPDGGLPWGVRVSQTTRGLTCLSVGRLDYATVGVLGQDGAFADDGRFHPLSPDYFEQLGCASTDARGRAFVNVALRELPASALWGQTPADGGCLAVPTPRQRATLKRLHTSAAPSYRTCPEADLRAVFFGVLGPQAKSISYHIPGGGTRTAPVLPPYGAYLLVFREGSVPANPLALGSTAGPGLAAGEIASVTYADGSTCRVPVESLVEACAPVGYAARRDSSSSPRNLATTAHVRVREAGRYCTTLRAIVPCGGTPPPGAEPLPRVPGEAGRHQVLAEVSFRAPVAISSRRAFYETAIRYRHGCIGHGSGVEGPTDYDIRPGQLVTTTFLIPSTCAGPVTGLVRYIRADGPGTSTPVIGLPGQGHPITIARFAFKVP